MKKNISYVYPPLCAHVRWLWPAPARPAGCCRRNRASWNSAAEAPVASCPSPVCLSLPLNAPWCGWETRREQSNQQRLHRQWTVEPNVSKVLHSEQTSPAWSYQRTCWNVDTTLTLCPGPCFCPGDRERSCARHSPPPAADAAAPPPSGHTVDRRTGGAADPPTENYTASFCWAQRQRQQVKT